MSVSINRIRPLSGNELIFRAMYQRYPQLHLDQPHLLEELDDATGDLPEYHQLEQIDPEEFPTSSVFDETPFKEKTSVSTRIHERFSPCFFMSMPFLRFSM